MIVALAVFGLRAVQSRAEVGDLTEYEIKVGLLYQFAVYTQWPKDALPEGGSEFVLGIVGDDPFGNALDFLRGKTVKSRKFVVKHFTNAQAMNGCHMLFICESEKENVPQILKALDKSCVLTISEVPEFIEQNGMINFVLKKTSRSERVRFEINKTAAEQAGLKLHSGFLKAAVRLSQ
jgi:YfiR/HmsC-like